MSDDQERCERPTRPVVISSPGEWDSIARTGHHYDRQPRYLPPEPPKERREEPRRKEKSFFDSWLWKMMRGNSNNG